MQSQPLCLRLRLVRRGLTERFGQERTQLADDASLVPFELANKLLDSLHRISQPAFVNVCLQARVRAGHERFAAVPHPVGGAFAKDFIEAGVQLGVKVEDQLTHLFDAGLPQRNLLEAGFSARCRQAEFG